MTYDNTKPDPGPSPTLDASIIQTNFSQFNSIFSKSSAGVNYNHRALNSNNQGVHESVLIELLTQDPSVNNNLCSLYAKNATSAAGTQPQLFVQIPKFLPTNLDPTNAPNAGMQLTYNQVNTLDPYQSFLAGGYLVYFGTVTSLPHQVTVSPSPTSLLIAIATFNTVSGTTGMPFTISTTINATNKFTISSSNASGSYKVGYLAIGTV